MNINSLPIEAGLQEKLKTLLNEFESYRTIHGDLKIKKVEITKEEKEVIETKKVNFFKKFFFSEFDQAS